MRRRTVGLPHVAFPLLVTLTVLLVQPATRPVAAEEPKTAVAADKAPAPAPPVQDPALGHRRKTNEFLLAVGLWFGVLVIGLALLAMIVSWGRSVRSVARRKPLTATAPDPLWYLKTKPPAPAASASTDRGPDDSEPGSDASTRTPV